MTNIVIKDGNGTNQTVRAPNPNGQATAVNSSPVVLASDQGPLPTNTDGVVDGSSVLGWAANTSANSDGFGSGLLGVTVLTGAPVITVTGTLSGNTNHPLDVFALSGSVVQTSITANGMYQVPAAGTLKYSIASGTATINLKFKR